MKSLTTTLVLLTSALGAYAQGPFNVSVLPANGSQDGTRTMSFTATWSSPSGAGSIRYAMFYMGGCQAYYTPSRIALLDPDTGTWVVAKNAVGFGSVQNRVCSVTVSKAHLDGDLLSVELLVTLSDKGAAKVYPIYLASVDEQGRVAGYEQKGTVSTTTPGY